MKVFRGKRVSTKTPIDKLVVTVRRKIPPPNRPPAIVADIPPRKWWFAEYIGPTMHFINSYQLLCYVSARAERLAKDAVEERWPHLKGFIRLEEFRTSTEWITTTWLQGGFKAP
jgi:hypothetical protein